jgi:hypothetical protein
MSAPRSTSTTFHANSIVLQHRLKSNGEDGTNSRHACLNRYLRTGPLSNRIDKPGVAAASVPNQISAHFDEVRQRWYIRLRKLSA